MIRVKVWSIAMVAAIVAIVIAWQSVLFAMTYLAPECNRDLSNEVMCTRRETGKPWIFTAHIGNVRISVEDL